VVQQPTKDNVDFLRVFLLEQNPYRRVTYSFNGMLERTQRLEIMTQTDWLKACETKKEKEITKFSIQTGNLCSTILNFLTLMLRNIHWDENKIYILGSILGSSILGYFYDFPLIRSYAYIKIFFILCT